MKLAGQGEIARGAMIDIVVRDGAYDRIAIREASEARQMLADTRRRHRCRDGAKLAADLFRRVRLRIERVELAHAAAGEDEQHRACAAEAKSSARLLGASS